MKKPGIEIYTDGSCIHSNEQETVGAWVAIVLIDEEKILLKHVVRNTTHNRMELLAVIHAIEFVISKKGIALPLVIYSDSQYVVNLKDRKEKLKEKNYLSNKGTPIQNADLVKSLMQLMETHQVELVKVKAHQKKGDAQNFNREADMLSRKLARDYLAEISSQNLS